MGAWNRPGVKVARGSSRQLYSIPHPDVAASLGRGLGSRRALSPCGEGRAPWSERDCQPGADCPQCFFSLPSCTVKLFGARVRTVVINVNLVSNLKAGLIWTCLMSGYSALCKPVSVLGQRSFVNEKPPLCNTTVLHEWTDSLCTSNNSNRGIVFSLVALSLICQSIYVSTLTYGHELWVMSSLQETAVQTQSMLGGLHIPSGLGTSWDPRWR